MLSTKAQRVFLTLGCCASFYVWLIGMAWAGEEELRCPAIINTIESVTTTDTWNLHSGDAQRSLRGVSIYSVGKDGREYELAPDNQTEHRRIVKNVWKLQGYRDSASEVLIRCHYTNTTLQLSTNIPSTIDICHFDAEVDSKGKVRKVVKMICK